MVRALAKEAGMFLRGRKRPRKNSSKTETPGNPRNSIPQCPGDLGTSAGCGLGALEPRSLAA